MNRLSNNGNTVFKWNLGGWLGSQIGGSAWILLSAIFLYSLDSYLFIKLIIVFSLINILGLALWKSKEKISAYLAFQLLILLCGLFSLLTVFLINSSGFWEDPRLWKTYSGNVGAISAKNTYILIVSIVALVMSMFYFKNKAVSKTD